MSKSSYHPSISSSPKPSSDQLSLNNESQVRLNITIGSQQSTSYQAPVTRSSKNAGGNQSQTTGESLEELQGHYIKDLVDIAAKSLSEELSKYPYPTELDILE